MKFSISSKLLLSHLSVVSKVVNTKNTISILDNFLFALKGDKLVITGSDQETILTTSVNVNFAEGEGKFAVNVKSLLDLLKEIPDQPLEFTIDSNYAIELVYQNGHFNFSGIDGNEFPQKEESEEDMVSIVMPVKELQEGIDYTLFAVGTEEMRRIMMGIYWDIKEDNITFVASDTHKLVRFENNRLKPGIVSSFILPSKPASILNGIIGKSDGDVKISFDSKSATFETENFMLTCRFINGKYPNYNSVIPKNNPFVISIDRVSLLNAVKRVSVFSSAGGMIKFDITENYLKLTAENLDFMKKAEETVPCDYQGETMSIGFNDEKLVEILNNIKSDIVVIKLLDPTRAGIFVPDSQPEGEDLLMLLMPMML